MVQQISVSFVIVHFRTQGFLDRLLVQLEKDVLVKNIYEIIVVDNNSQNGVVLENSFLGVRLISNRQNLGFGRANNQAVKVTRGQYLVFVNPDTRIVSGRFKDAIDFMESHTDVGFLGPKIIWPDGRIQVSASGFLGLGWAVGHHLHLKNFLPNDFLRKTLVPFRKILGGALRSYLFVYQDIKEPEKVDWLTGAFLMVRKKVFEELGGFDEDYFLYFEDQDLALRAKQKGYESYYFPSVVVEHAVGSSMKKNPRALIEKYRSELIFWIKHYSDFSLFCLRILMAIDFSFRFLFARSKEMRSIYREILHYVFLSKEEIVRRKAMI